MYEPNKVDEARIIDDRTSRPRSFYRRVGILFFGGATLTAIVWGGISYLYAPHENEAAFQESIGLAFMEAVNPEAPVEFILVPATVVDDAISLLTTPATTTDMVVWEERTTARNLVSIDTPLDTVYDFPVGDTFYEVMVNEVPFKETLFQMHDEVRELVYQVNFQSGQDIAVLPLATRVGKEDEVRFIESVTLGTPPIISTAPSIRVVEATVVGQLLAHLFPAEATYYNQLTEEYIDRGITYGLYGPEDVLLSQEIGRLYWSAFKESPQFSQITITQVSQ